MKQTLVRKIRNELGITQENISGILGITQSNYSLIEGGKRELSKRVLDSFVNRLKVNYHYLKGQSDQLFTIDVPLLSDRILKALKSAKVNLHVVYENISPSLAGQLRSYIENNAYPESDEVLYEIFKKWKDVDVDYIIRGKSLYEIEREPEVFASNVRDPENQLTSAHELANAFKKVAELQQEKINSLEQKIEELQEMLNEKMKE